MQTEVASEISFDKFNLVIYTFSDGNLINYVVDKDVTIGRLSETGNADIKINSRIVSRRQGRIYKNEGYYLYEDCGSTNGTYVNGRLFGKDSPSDSYRCILKIGDVLRIDHDDLICPHENAVIMVVTKAYDTPVVTENVSLRDAESIEIGRNFGALKLDDKKVSEKHAKFIYEQNAWYIEDLNSTNGVFINNSRITGKVRLNLLDVVRIADYVFIFIGENLYYFHEEKVSGQLEISIKNRVVRKGFKKQVLIEDINLSIEEGEMVMLLGGSGAGKTTFMNAIMGYEKANGTIIHNGVDIYDNYNQAKNKIGYVPQQDLLRLKNTVYKTLKDAADLNTDNHISKEEKNAKIDSILKSMGLIDYKKSFVEKLSGGQKKKLSAAVELIQDRTLFFLDEADSGLDANSATELFEYMRTIADDNKIVMVITHSPDRNRNLFDKVIVLAKGDADNIGHLAFYGTVDDAMAFFETDDLSSIMKKINRKNDGGEGLSDYFIEKFAKERNVK